MNVSLLKDICTAHGAPGYEKPIRDLVLTHLDGLVDEHRVDQMGNIISLKKARHNPDSKKVMVAAHMDEIGFIVTHIDDQGFIRFHTLGGFDPKTLTAQRVIIHGKEDVIGVMGCKPIHVMSPEERTKVLKTKDYFIDCGLPAEQVKELINVGNPITREREFIEMGECVNCKSIDNRISVYILLQALQQLEDFPYDIYAVFSVQEEVGLRGAQVAAQQIDPDFGFGLDTTIAYDMPGAAAHEHVTDLGKGAAIKIMDASAISDYRMVEYLKQVAEEHKISWQPEILTAGGTDTASIQKHGKHGAISGAISVPTRYLHQVIEMAHKQDIDQCVQLLARSLEQLHNYDWSH